MFSALNERTWEHMKLLVAPTIIVGAIQYFLLNGDYNNVLNAILFLLVTELVTMPLIYETLRLIIHKVPFLITILIFFLSIIFGLIVEFIILNSNVVLLPELVSLIVILIIISLFGIFSYYPPKRFIFKDPITGKYGDPDR